MFWAVEFARRTAHPRRDGDVGRGRGECNGACHGRGLCRLNAAEPAHCAARSLSKGDARTD
eukprot:14357-Prymnesium_polylepis.1